MNRINCFSITGITLAFAAMFAFARPAAAQTTYTWNVASGNWSIPGSWNPGTSIAGPTNIDTAIFGNNDTTASSSTINNTVDSNYGGTVSNLTYNSVSISPLVYNVTQIPVGTTLTVPGIFLAGGVNGINTADTTEAFMVGGGNLVVTGTNLMVQNYDNTSRSGATAYLDLSGLDNFTYYNPSGAIRIEDRLPSDSTDTGLGGNMAWASVSNSITAASLNWGTSVSAQAGPAGTVILGAGTNIINVSSFNVGAEKSTFVVTNLGGGLRIRGVTGADSDSSDNITIGNRNVGSSTGNANGYLFLNGCNLNIKANTLIIGENSGGPPSSAFDQGVGVLQFDTGTISANTVIMADDTSANNANGNQARCSGTIQVGPNATLLIGAGQVFDLASATSTGPSSGLMIISNGLINCQGPIAMGPNNGFTNTGVITFLGGGQLLMGPNSYIGAFTNPITSLNMAAAAVLSVSIPSTTYTNICSRNVAWPASDSGMTIAIAAMPAGVVVPSVFPLLYTTNFTGTFNSPILTLPAGFQGHLSQVGLAPTNTILLTITQSGPGGVDLLTNSSFASSPPPYWTASGGASVVSTNSTYPNTSSCTHDSRNIVSLFGTNVAKLTGSFVAGGSTNTWSQNVPVAAGTAFTAGGFAYAAHEDMMSGADSFYYEVDFLNSTGGVITAWESSIVSNLTCGETTPFPIDAWNSLGITNAMQVTGGVNTGVVISNVVNTFLAPPGTVSSTYKAVLIQRNATDTGSMYLSAEDLGLTHVAVGPSISSVTPNLITLCTNTTLTCVATSTITTLSGVRVTVTTNTFLGTSTNTITYTVGSPGLTVTGLGTSSATIQLALAANTIYSSVVITVTDADNLVTSPTTVNFDTITPTLVIEASDYNFTSNSISGLFFDTPPTGGVALYTNLIGTQSIDENKITRANPGTQGYYRTNDSTIINAANPASPSGTEQKFITALANGDTIDTEQMVAFDSVGDWQNYSRTFGNNVTNSAAAGTYNVWCYLAVSGSGPQVAFYQVASSPGVGNQTTNIVGTFGGPSFSDNGYANFVYAPLVDQFGNRVTLTIASGEQTYQAQIANSDTPNVGFYMLTPVAPVFTPEFLNVYPNSQFQQTNEFTFSVGPAQGASILTNGITVIINGITITSGLTFTAVGGGDWTVTYPVLSNQVYSVAIDVTNTLGLGNSYSGSFSTFSYNNFRWMAVDYDFSTNNGTSAGGSVGDGWTAGLFITNAVPTGGANAYADNLTYQYTTNSYFGWPIGLYPSLDTVAGLGSTAHYGVDVNWITNLTQDPALLPTNSIYRLAYVNSVVQPDGVGSQVASDSFLLPEVIAARTSLLVGSDGSTGMTNDITEFNIGYFYTNDWLNYTRIYPTGTFNVWGRLAAGNGAFTNCTLSVVTSGAGTSNQMTQVLGFFSDSAPAGFQTYHWIEMSDTNGNPAYINFSGLETLRLTAPTNSTPSGNALNPLFFMLTPAVGQASAFSISASLSGTSVLIGIPTQSNHAYTLLSAPVVNGTWSQVGGTIIGNGSTQFVSQPASSAQVYYRVTVQ